MGYVPGPTLADKLKHGIPPTNEGLSVLMDIANAVHYAHTQGVVHRDLKPSNILMGDDRRAPPDGVSHVCCGWCSQLTCFDLFRSCGRCCPVVQTEHREHRGLCLIRLLPRGCPPLELLPARV
jgi:serine/threonine protein kinase